MRIIGGDLRGKQITPPSNYKARPTTDFAKEGLFNILENQFDFSEISVLDLFSGTGSISFEFASRGSNSVTAIEMNPQHSSFIKNTIAKFGLANMQVVHHNVFDFLHICNHKYDIVFADPPYDIVGFAGIPEKILSCPIFYPGGILIVEHPASLNFKSNPLFTKERKYGNVHFSFFSTKLS
jgi:16S rRNA (guanine966-N2)-methyltransferase